MGCWYIASTTTTIGRTIEQTKEAVVSKYTKANGFIDDAEVVTAAVFLFLVFFL